MKVTTKEVSAITIITEMTVEEATAIRDFIGVTSRAEREEMGLTEEQSVILSGVYDTLWFALENLPRKK